MFDGAKPGTDIENLLQWAYAQTVYLDYRNASPRALAYNHGYTAIPKGFHSTFEGGDVAVTMLSSTAADARRIVAAVELLDPWTQAIVTRCAKSQVRPDCFLGVEAREVKTTLSWRKRKKGGGKKKAHSSTVTTRWEPCHPAAICAAREIYLRWHTALGRLAIALAGELNDWAISGFAAPEHPWNEPIKENA